MPTTDEVGLTIPVIDDGANVPDSFLQFRGTLKPQIVPRFGSTTARNSAFTAAQFRVCTVGDVLYLRRGTTWSTMLAAEDIDTGWLAPTMSANWSSLTADPIRYRVSAGWVQWRGSAFRSDGIPAAATAMVAVPSNALPSNVSGFNTNTLSCPAVGTSAVTDTAKAFASLTLRSNGTVTCDLPYGAVSGVTKVGAQALGWAL